MNFLPEVEKLGLKFFQLYDVVNNHDFSGSLPADEQPAVGEPIILSMKPIDDGNGNNVIDHISRFDYLLRDCEVSGKS